jgi:hypothetical protein
VLIAEFAERARRVGQVLVDALRGEREFYPRSLYLPAFGSLAQPDAFRLPLPRLAAS